MTVQEAIAALSALPPDHDILDEFGEVALTGFSVKESWNGTQEFEHVVFVTDE